MPIPTEGMTDGSSMEYTRQASKATGYYIDPEFWECLGVGVGGPRYRRAVAFGGARFRGGTDAAPVHGGFLLSGRRLNDRVRPRGFGWLS
ncbi:hypothetical protein [Actinoplanes sp. DH11]|uniref:hypothetical protein n=1 Tax=Actinoplanes sp. DH11 TaxID=2857011 RepID=UPI001E619828|nr:hypothetical protein [Actinoplanes sp. DH11]